MKNITKKIRNGVWDKAWHLGRAQFDNQIWSEVMRYTWWQIDNKVRNQITYTIRHQLRNWSY